jgi:SAM-dependent methyltransferase/DNA-binding transcriptional ArsR family regulator
MTRAAVHTHLLTLSDPTRSRILVALQHGELTVGELCAILQLPQSTVSRHLRVLAQEKWLAARQEGTSRYYVLRQDIEPPARQLWDLVREEVRVGGTGQDDEARRQRVLADRRARSKAYFESAGSEWEEVREALFGGATVTSALLNLLDESWTVGDLGCGTGQISALLAPHVKLVVAVDASESMLRTAGSRLARFDNVDFRLGDLQQLPLETSSLDVAVLSLVLHHSAEPARALREVGRTLRPGGKLLIVDLLPHDRLEFQQQLGHVWLGFTADQIRHWLRQSAFAETRVEFLSPMAGAAGPRLFAATARRSELASRPNAGDGNGAAPPAA